MVTPMTQVRYGRPAYPGFGSLEEAREWRRQRDARSANAVLFDMWCGEPVAWCRPGAVVRVTPWPGPEMPHTHVLTPEDAAREYGSLAWIVTGPGGGFEMACYGDRCFVSRLLDPRPVIDPPITWINDPVIANHGCPRCGVPAGSRCEDPKGVQRHMARVKPACGALVPVGAPGGAAPGSGFSCDRSPESAAATALSLLYPAVTNDATACAFTSTV